MNINMAQGLIPRQFHEHSFQEKFDLFKGYVRYNALALKIA